MVHDIGPQVQVPDERQWHAVFLSAQCPTALHVALPRTADNLRTRRERHQAGKVEQLEEDIRLVRSAPNALGLHTGTALSREVSRGRQLRIRRGIYASSHAWSAALPSSRYHASMAAAALADASGVFCRESALMLHGLPLLTVPSEVHLRTLHRSQVGLHGDPGRLTYPTRLHEPPLPRGVTRAGLRAALAADRESHWVVSERITPACLRGLTSDSTGSAGLTVLVEPLAQTLLDTVPRMPFDHAVVVLDAALARAAGTGTPLEHALDQWQHFLHIQRFRRAWDHAFGFADPRSESVGESLSRVRIAELGFAVPELQTRVWVEGREYRLDFEWEGGVVGEFDGKHKYLRSEELFGTSAEETVYQEKLREDAIRSTGRRVVRWSWEDLHRPGVLGDRLARAGAPRA